MPLRDTAIEYKMRELSALLTQELQERGDLWVLFSLYEVANQSILQALEARNYWHSGEMMEEDQLELRRRQDAWCQQAVESGLLDSAPPRPDKSSVH